MAKGIHRPTVDLAELADELQALARAAKEHAAAAGTNDPDDPTPYEDMLQGVGALCVALECTETAKRNAELWRK